MATINFELLGKSNPSNIYCRFVHTRNYQFRARVNIFINPKFWNSKQQKIKNVLEVKNKNIINKKLNLLRQHIIDSFNECYSEGVLIDKHWLEIQIKDFFQRPQQEKENKTINDYKIYFIHFSKWWMTEKSEKWRTKSGKPMSSRSLSSYNQFIKLFEDFVVFTFPNKKIMIRKCGHETLEQFIQFLSNLNYSTKTIDRHKTRFRFFINRALEEKLEINSSYSNKVHIPRQKEILDPILNTGELRKIFNMEIKNEALDNARDNLLIAAWTGLRISDFNKKLSENNIINNDFIQIRTTKTDSEIIIPLHLTVKKVLEKRNGKLPKKVNNALFNKQIKKVCELAGLDEKMEGSIYKVLDSGEKRNVRGWYKKYELVTSHIGRRSFATNHYGKVKDEVIMEIASWKSKTMMLKYVNKLPMEHAIELKEYWEQVSNKPIIK
ncbi:Phage integrase family protein [Tenacibaculum sp. MAR_2009_124]|uniref:tyrosine-type recombinase/integrase n=1 Tax=Tenacibaculum sp. MAR_2009_124 TaxID=1250059 RepID=UPI00089AE8A6|nr:tyrosine-type recombinase/integrase [Tenacibaculum sp. MAR_2009_124]SED09099.1 Phage integrase family protein [Tenacibaculum sp. MAR_2009_124]